MSRITAPVSRNYGGRMLGDISSTIVPVPDYSGQYAEPRQAEERGCSRLELQGGGYFLDWAEQAKIQAISPSASGEPQICICGQMQICGSPGHPPFTVAWALSFWPCPLSSEDG